MNLDNATEWAQYLTNPFTLAGFIILIFIGTGLKRLLKHLPVAKQKGADTYRLIRFALIGGFILSLLALVLGFGIKYLESNQQIIGNIEGSVVEQVNANCASKTDQSINGVENSHITQAACAEK